MSRVELVIAWCFDRHDWIDVTNLGDSEQKLLCAHCGATTTRPLATLQPREPSPVVWGLPAGSRLRT